MPIYRYVLVASLVLGAGPAMANPVAQADPAVAKAAPTKVVADVQTRINAARLQSLANNDVSGLEVIAAQLKAANVGATGQAAYYGAYWLAYTDYLLASRHLKENRRPEAAALLSEASGLLTNAPSADVETYTLLSLVAGQQIVAGTPQTMGESMGQARDALERAIALDPNNTRVLYTRALADYTTPKEYGGGRVAERFAERAVGRPFESTRGLKPGWGHDDAAALLVKILRASGRASDADALLARFLVQYPASAPLHQVSEASK